MVAVIKEMKMGIGRDERETSSGEERVLRLPDLLNAGNLVLYDESEEKLKVIMGRFLELCRRKV